jgi:glutaredoxin 3
MSERNANVVVYSSPFCGYCAAAKRLLEDKGVAYEDIDVMFEAGKRAEMVARSGRHTVPQIFVGERHIGGFDDLNALDEVGELERILADAQLPSNP